LHVGAHSSAPSGRKPRSLGSLIAGFKGITSKRINDARGTPGDPVWQRNYFERVIRNEGELQRIREYIAINPGRWADDQENPANAARW
jgi:REP element-mobilizing transposase RayT